MAGEVRYYTVEDAAQIMRLSPERVREMLEDGELEGVRTGDAGGWRVPLRGGPVAAAPPPATPPAPPPMEEPVMEPAAGDREARGRTTLRPFHGTRGNQGAPGGTGRAQTSRRGPR